MTTIVLSIALETTTPRRSWRRPRSCSGFGTRTIGLRSALGAARRRVFGDAQTARQALALLLRLGLRRGRRFLHTRFLGGRLLGGRLCLRNRLLGGRLLGGRLCLRPAPRRQALAAATALVQGFDAREDDLTVSPIPNALVLFNPPLNFKGGKVMDGEGVNIADQIAPTHSQREGARRSFYGTKDGMKTQGSEYVAKCKEWVGAEMYLAEDEPHGFYNRSPWVEATVEKVDGFLQALGYLQRPAQVKVPEDARPLVKP